uniref:G-protein coupled receptors family 1 profile domain-containing protein n=1 Tax=Ditylenchus dipsaci TaxID=166011 RepID=A0A915DWV8_9BILA
MRFSGMNLLLLNLAVADLLYLIVFVHAWIPILLYAIRYLSNVFIIASIFTYTAICIERYIAIVHPMRASNLCSRQNIFLIRRYLDIRSDISAAICHFLSTVSICLNPYGNHAYWAIFKWSEVILTYAIPYTKEDSITEAVAARRNVVKMLIACVAIFYICYTPMISFYAYGFFWKTRLPLSWEAVLWITAMVMGVSAFNPFLYTLFSKSFRIRVKEIITCSKSSSWAKKELKRSERNTTKSIYL